MTFLAAATAMWLLLPLAADLWSLARAVQRTPSPSSTAPRAERLLVLVPSHNDAPVLGASLEAMAAARPEDHSASVVVVADRCTDDTAAVARARQVRCLERLDGPPGKPAALGWALSRLAGEPWDAVVIVDADSSVDRDFFAVIGQAGPWRDRGCQCLHYLPAAQTWLQRLAALFVSGRYLFAYALKSRGGINCQLAGNGMILGRDVVAAVEWGRLGPAEDFELYALLTLQGTAIAYVPRARLRIRSEAHLRTAARQRQRWAAGRWIAARRFARALLLARRLSFHQRLDAVAELLTPGPVMHAAIVTGTATAVVAAGAPLATVVVPLLGLTLLRPATYALAALPRQPDPWRVVAAGLALPGYALWRMAVAVVGWRLLRHARWEKTERLRDTVL